MVARCRCLFVWLLLLTLVCQSLFPCECADCGGAALCSHDEMCFHNKSCASASGSPCCSQVSHGAVSDRDDTDQSTCEYSRLTTIIRTSLADDCLPNSTPCESACWRQVVLCSTSDSFDSMPGGAGDVVFTNQRVPRNPCLPKFVAVEGQLFDLSSGSRSVRLQI